MIGLALALLLALAGPPAAGQQPAAAPARDVPVVACGIAHRQTISYVGGALRARPVDARSTPLQVVVEPGGAPASWNLEVVGFQPGSFDVRDYLEHVDGTVATGLATIPVRFVSLLPPGVHLELETTAAAPAVIAGRPSWLWRVLAALWVALPAAWLAARWWKRRAAARKAPRPEAACEADPLDELVGLVGQRPLTTPERARLELLLLRRLGEPATGQFGSNANPYLVARTDPAAAEILDAVESWLHHPQAPVEIERRLVEALRGLPRAAVSSLGEARP